MQASQCFQLRAEGKAQLCLEAAAAAAEQAAADAQVLACKAWALACLNRYGEALEALDALDAAENSATTTQRLEIRALRRQVERCMSFADELAHRWEHASQQLQLGEEWYGQAVQERMTPCGMTFPFRNYHMPVVLEAQKHAVYLHTGPVGSWTKGLFFGAVCNQATGGVIHAKRRTLALFGDRLKETISEYMEDVGTRNWEQGCEEFINHAQLPKPIGIFPTLEGIHHKPNVYQADPSCDVWVMENALPPHSHSTLKALLDARAEATLDFPMPMYQNIIDPNLLVQDDGLESTWSASLFDVKEASSLDVAVALQLVAKELCNAKLPGAAMRTLLEFAAATRPVAKLMTRVHDLDPADNALLHLAIEEVFNAAVPLLAELRRPALLLPGALQAVVKAQRIYLEPGQEYEGVWHYDGKNEDIVAVAIYFYRYSSELEGGALEFMDKGPRDDAFWVGGDCTPDPLTKDDVHAYYDEKPHCKVAVGEGMLVVFSNYQFIHRVLRMRHTGSSGIASRDFLLFFVVDQRCTLPSTEEVRPAGNRFELRDQLLQDQLQPAGTFGISSEYVFSTGNGSAGHLGWLRSGERQEADEYWHFGSRGREGIRQLKAFDYCPPVGRGLSWVFEAADEELCNPASEYFELRRHEGADEGSAYESVYVHMPSNREEDAFPLEGIRYIAHEFREAGEPAAGAV